MLPRPRKSRNAAVQPLVDVSRSAIPSSSGAGPGADALASTGSPLRFDVLITAGVVLMGDTVKRVGHRRRGVGCANRNPTCRRRPHPRQTDPVRVPGWSADRVGDQRRHDCRRDAGLRDDADRTTLPAAPVRRAVPQWSEHRSRAHSGTGFDNEMTTRQPRRGNAAQRAPEDLDFQTANACSKLNANSFCRLCSQSDAADIWWQ